MATAPAILLVMLIAFVFAAIYDFFNNRKVKEVTPEVEQYTDQQILDRKCHEYLKGDHW